MFKILVIIGVIASITNYSEGLPNNYNDPYTPVINLLKELRKARKYGGGLSPIRNGQGGNFGSTSNGQIPQFQFPSNSGGGSGSNGQIPQFQFPSNSGSGSGSADPTSTPILTPGSSSGGSGGNFQIPGSGGNFQIPGSSIFPSFPNIPGQIGGQIGALPTLPPYPIEQVGKGVGTIINGVKKFDLGEILRGSFSFTTNENVKSVAGSVIDSIFGGRN